MKKFLSIIITIILTLQNVSICFAENTHWAQNYADELFKTGIVKGDAEGFRFESLVTRAEFVALINRAFDFTDTDTPAFSDVTENDWYYLDFLKARKAGYLKGDLNGNANPKSSITRVEAVTILYRILNLNGKSKALFSDDSKIPEWGRDAVYTLAFNNILSGYEDNTFKPEKSLTRAEAFVVIYKSLPFVEEKEEEKPEPSTVIGVTVGGKGGGGGGSYAPPAVVPATLKITLKDETAGKEKLTWSNASSVYNVTIKRTTTGKANSEATHTIKTNSINVAQYASALVPNAADRLINETFLVTVTVKEASVSETVNITFPYIKQPELSTSIECIENTYYMVVSWDEDESVKEYSLKMDLDGTGYQDIALTKDDKKYIAKINTATLKDIPYTLDAIENPFNVIPMATKSGTLENLFYYEDEEFFGVAKIVNPVTISDAFDNIKAGDIILLDKGEYNNLSLSATVDGTAQNKILIRSLNDGEAVFGGESIITINSDYTTLSGISFVDNKGIDSCSIKVKECTNSRVTGCYFKTCGDVATGSILYLGKSAKNIRVDNNLFEDSRALSVVAYGDDDTSFDDSATDNLIYDNLFINIKSVSSAYSGSTNGMECIQLGQSPKDGVKLNNTVSHNMFYNVTGDGSEIISNKSNGNIYKNNTFYNCNSSPTFRNGDDCEFSGNFIINCKYALRTFGKNHKIENNYIYKTGHIAFDAGYQILDKIIYSSADNCQVTGNMIIKPKDSAIYYGRFYDTLNLRNTLASNITVEDNYIYVDKGKVCTYHAAFNPIDFSNNIIINDGMSDIPTFDGELYITSQMNNFSTLNLYRPEELNIWWKDVMPPIKGYDTLEEKGLVTGYTPYKTAFSLCSEDTLDVTTLAGTVRVSGGSYKVNSADVSYTLVDETYASLTGDILTVTNNTKEIKEVILNSSYAGFENQITISVYPKAPYSDATKDYFDYQTNVDLKVISGSTLWETGVDGSIEYKGNTSTKIILPTYTHKDDFSLEFDLTLNSNNPSSANFEFLFGYDVISGTAHRVKLLNNGGVFLTSDNNTRSGELVKQLEIGVTKRMQIVKRDDILVVSYGDDILTMAKLPEETSGKFGLNLSSCNIKIENIDIFEGKADNLIPETISMTYSRIDDNTIKVNYTSIGNYIYRLFKDGICLGESGEISNFVDVSVTMDENHEYKLYVYDKNGVLVGEGELSLTITASSSDEYFKISDVLVKVGENDSYVENYYKSSNRFLDEYTEIYDDRDYTYSSLPEMFKDCGYILTRNSDRTLDSYKTAKSDWLKFKINQPATVYIVLQASHTVPSWLADWGVYSGDLVSTDTLSSTKVYLKHFDGGEVTIGSFSTLSANYSVIVKPDTMPEPVEIIRKFK